MAADAVIARVGVRVVAVPDVRVRWSAQLPEFQPHLNLVSVSDGAGFTGTASTWLPTLRHEVVDAVEQYIAPLLIGRSVDDHPAIWADLERVHYFTPMRSALSAIDIALWDLRARRAGLPLCELLGAKRERLACYASGLPQPSPDDATADALAARRAGLRGYKLHTFSLPHHDVDVCRSLRRAVGSEFELILDPINSYDYDGALSIGRVLDELGFAWFEAPMPDDEVTAYRNLCQAIETPVANGEVRVRGLADYAELLRHGAIDIVRCAADVQGGLTVLRRAGELAASHNRRLEPRSYGSTLVQAVHLHWALSVTNCDFFEVPWPRQWLDFGAKTSLAPDEDGCIAAPPGPGLGIELDWDALDNATVLLAASCST